MTNIIYHPMTGKKVDIYSLQSAELRSPNRLYKPDKWREFYAPHEDPSQTRLYGLEFEFNVIDNHQEIDFDHIGFELLSLLNKHEQHAHILDDFSVRNGVEVIFQPMSKSYLEANIDFKAFFKLVKDLGLTSTHDTGFHIHVNLKPSLRERNLILRLFSISYPLWIYLSQRKIVRLQNRYVSTEFFMMQDKVRKRHEINLAKIQTEKTSHVSFQDLLFDNYDTNNRYNAINLCNPKTTEFRLFTGTVDHHNFCEILNFVCSFINLVDEIGQTRIDTVFTLDQFVSRTHCESLLKGVYQLINKSDQLLKHGKLYYNHFYLLDTYWYESTYNNAIAHDYIMKKDDYDYYLKLLKSLEDLNIKKHDIFDLKEGINDFLLGKTYQIIDIDNHKIEAVPVFYTTERKTLQKDEVLTNWVILRCVNRDLISHLI